MSLAVSTAGSRGFRGEGATCRERRVPGEVLVAAVRSAIPGTCPLTDVHDEA